MILNHDQLVERIYEAAIAPGLWPALLTDLARGAGGDGGLLTVWRTDPVEPPRYQISQHLTKGAVEWVHSDAPRRSTAAARLVAVNRPGFVGGDEIFTPEEYAEEPVIKEWAMHNDLHHGAATAVQIPSGDYVLVQFMRHIGEPAFNRLQLDYFDVFRPHLARAGMLAARWRLERVRTIAAALEWIGLPAAILELSGRVLAANPLIQAMTGHIVWLPRDRVSVADPGAAALLRRAIRDLGHAAAPCTRSFPVRAGAAGDRVVMHVIPASRSAHDVFDGGFGVLAITPISAPGPPDAALIQGLFDLTPAEARVAGGIAIGLTAEQIAVRHKVSRETVRSQIKAVLGKIGVSSKTQAAGLLGTISAAGPVAPRR